MMDPLVVSGIFSFIVNLTIGLLVLWRNPKGSVNRLFALFSVTVSGWSIGSFLENVIPDQRLALFVLRTCYLFGVLLPAFYVHFIYRLTDRFESRKRLISVLYSCSALMLLFVFSPWFIKGLRMIGSSGFRISSPGPLYYVFFIFFCFAAVKVLATLLRATKRSAGLEKIQLSWLLFANVIAITAGIEYFSKVFGFFHSPPTDDYLLVMYFGIMAYAILKHQALDIRIVITRTSLIIATYLVVLGVPFLVGLWGQTWLERWLGHEWWLVPLGLCTALATIGPFVYPYLRHRAEARLLKEQLRYRRTLQLAARGMTRVRNATKLSNLITRTVSRTVGAMHASLFMWDGAGQYYTLRASHGPRRLSLHSRYKLEYGHPLIEWLHEHQTILVREELEGQPDSSVMFEADCLAAELIIPGFIEERLIGFLALGSKRSGIRYSGDDLHAFATLANEAAVAIENALSYEELVKANEQLKAASERLLIQERMVAAGKFATGMAHEIKNPLSAIKTFAQYLPEKYRDPEFRQKFSRIVQGEIDRINTIVEELLDFAKPAPPNFQSVRLSELVSDTLALLSNHCLKQGVELHNTFKENGLTVNADPHQLKQVLLNVVLNSLDAMAEKGGTLTISSERFGSNIKLRIADTGCGVAPERLNDVWDPFFTTKERGMGLGLAIVKGIVERHGGQINLSSQPGKGTVVELSLPVSSS